MPMRYINNYVNKIEKSETIDKKLCGFIVVVKCSATNITTVSSLAKDVAFTPTTSNIASDNEVTSDSETSNRSSSLGYTDSESVMEPI
jgi:hypothetical protein